MAPTLETLPAGAIAGIAIGILILAFALAFLAYFLHRRSAAKSATKFDDPEKKNTNSSNNSRYVIDVDFATSDFFVRRNSIFSGITLATKVTNNRPTAPQRAATLAKATAAKKPLAVGDGGIAKLLLPATGSLSFGKNPRK
ncbi:hypothetical protein HK100_007102, partial [Physocladia obscura]